MHTLKFRALKKAMAVTIVLAVLFASAASALACTSVYFGKDTTDTGAYYWGRTEDISAGYTKLLQVQQAEIHEPGDMFISGTWNSGYTVFSPRFQWPYPEKTLRYIYCSDSIYNERNAPQPYAEVGVNEKGVAISATVTLSGTKSAILTRDPHVSRANGGLDEVDVTTVVLMQAETARDACELIAKIIDTAGATGREGLMLSDPNEVWFFQWLSGHQYVAVKCPDDMLGLSPNITCNVGDKDGYVDVTDTDNVIVSPGFVSIPKAAGVLVAKDDDTKVKVADTYSSDAVTIQGQSTPGSDHWNHSRLRSGFGYFYGLTTTAQIQALNPTQVKYLDYYNPPRQNKKYSLYEAMRILACRGEGTDWESASSIGNASTVEAHIFETRINMPAELATVEWICLAPAEYGVYLPYYGNLVTEVFEKNYFPDPSSRTYNNTDPDANSMYWVFRELYAQCAVSNLADRARLGDGVKAFWEKYQKSLIAQQAEMDKIMGNLCKNNPAALEETATSISMTLSEQTYQVAKELLAELKAFKNGNGSGPFVPSFLNDPSKMPNYTSLQRVQLAPTQAPSFVIRKGAMSVIHASNLLNDLTFTSSNSNVVSVSPAGVITGKSSGVAVIQVKSAGTGQLVNVVVNCTN